MKSYIKISFFLTLFFLSVNVFSQKENLKGNFDTATTVKYNKWSIYAYGGLSQFYGDIVPRYSYSPLFNHNGIVSLNGFAGISRQLTRLFSFDGRFEIANLSSERMYSIAYTNSGTPESDSLYFKSDLFNISLASTFSFSNWFWPNIKNRHWNAYFILGTGFTFYRSASYYLNKGKENKIYDYYGYKKLNDYDLEKDNRQIVPSATIGIGLKYRITKRLDLGIEFTETSVYNDRLDAYVRVLSERDKFGHLDIGLSYHFEKNKKTLVWDFNDFYPEPINFDSIITNRICDCPIVKTTATTVDSISKAYTAMSIKTDSVMAVLKRDKEIDSDNDKVPDYRDFEPNSAPGALVDAKGVTIKEPEIVNPIIKPTKTGKANIANDSLIAIINKLNSTVDALVRERNLEKGPDTDNDKIPDYRDDELNSAPGAIVNAKGVTIKGPETFVVNSKNPVNDSLLSIVGRLNIAIDTLLHERNLEKGPDKDNDKVPDYRDLEPNSAPGASVDTRGVTIKNAKNIPTSTNPAITNIPITNNAAVDSLTSLVGKLTLTIDTLVRDRNLEKGPDKDNDKVPDYRDLEPNSAPGASVDTRGVTIKTPKNVPINTNPAIANIPITNNAAVDSLTTLVGRLTQTIDTLMRDRNLEKGPDTDNDKVPDYRDAEPNSAPGALVDWRGVTIPTPNTDNSNTPMMVMIKGTILDENQTPIEAQVDVIEKKSKEPVASFGTNGVNGKYAISLPSGKEYSISVKAKGYTFYSETLSVPDTAKAKLINKGISMIKLEPGKRIVLRNIFYDFDKSTLRPESNVELMNILELLNTNPNLKIQISSHTDNIGSAAYNKNLSLERAKSVVDFLISRGISRDRLVSAGYGFDQPMTSNDTDAGRQLNRRTEFMIISN